ncbi:hypothetical protein ER308_15055 [Egibacter rhizosphaerae]|uniref:Uncharacterized protein n=1 Tax=Egibacter rhizosphaerae TaxID=1670831 RepID=A0A411YHM9_9ACTN|nr:hypothetical protein [Egibacter rhizosphaerae]QBI20750.1 hypothetical protein ER308_15055 [Egibacter rhizosphaerae]
MSANATYDPDEVARELIESYPDGARDIAARVLDRTSSQPRVDALRRLLSVWDVSRAEAAAMFGVSRQALSQWVDHGDVPADRADRLATLSAATDLLEHYVKVDRIPAVVRRPAEDLGGESLLQLAVDGRADEALRYARDLFDIARWQS